MSSRVIHVSDKENHHMLTCCGRLITGAMLAIEPSESRVVLVSGALCDRCKILSGFRATRLGESAA